MPTQQLIVVKPCTLGSLRPKKGDVLGTINDQGQITATVGTATQLRSLLLHKAIEPSGPVTTPPPADPNPDPNPNPDVPPYTEWKAAELKDEAKARKISPIPKNKPDLIAALEAHDEANPE
ncbi:MAG: hypothetical protein AAF750_15490 [Planctomycetota bacterium]